MAIPAKETIYVDVDDEITGVIDKVQAASGKIVALVLPKRAAVFQSIVNMKLLKRSADSSKKSLVLITSEASLLPLAGAVGLHVAKTLQSKPAIPAAPKLADDAPVAADEVAIEPDEPLDTSKSVGALAGLPPESDEEAIEVDNDDLPAAAAAAGATKKSFNKKLKVPNFDSFRKRLLLGGAALVALIIFFILAIFVLPKATIAIQTDTTDVESSLAITASPTAKELNAEKKIVPALVKEYKKTDSQKAPATGQKNVGEKAKGEVTLSLTDCSKEQVTVPAGTIVSASSLNFVTQADVTMQSVKIGPSCKNSDFKNISTAKVSVVAQSPGDQYNLSARNYSVQGFSNVSGAGSAMGGGSSKIIKVVSQQDIDNLKQKIIDANNATATQEISNQLKDAGYFPLKDTLKAKDPLVVASPNVDSEAEEVTVNVTLTYTMVGAKQDALKELVEADIKTKIDTSKQNILDNGLEQASIRIDHRSDDGQTQFEIKVTARVGVEPNKSDIRQAIAGKKKKEAQAILEQRPGVKAVTVQLSPFWVTKVPSKDSKVNITFEQQNSNNE